MSHRPIPALDGIRGVAVLLVLELHFNPRNGWAFPQVEPAVTAVDRIAARIHGLSNTGWIGVDLFFVLSGFLITRGLVAQSEDPLRRRLGKFLMRRALRIFPLYYVVLLIGTFVGIFYARSVLPNGWYWLYLQNYAQAFDKVELSWTGHLWSLAVEEQFYLFWPVVVLVTPAHVRPWLCLVLVGIACTLRFVLFRMSPWDTDTTVALVYRATFTRVDGLLLGAFAAQAATTPQHVLARAFRRARGVLWVGALAVLALLYLRTGLNPFDRQMILVGYPVLALAFTATVSLAADGTFGSRLFDRAPLRAVGKVSYGMYLLHWPVVVFVWPAIVRWQSSLGSLAALAFAAVLTLAACAVTYGVAVLVYKNFEIPFLRLKERFED